MHNILSIIYVLFQSTFFIYTLLYYFLLCMCAIQYETYIYPTHIIYFSFLIIFMSIFFCYLNFIFFIALKFLYRSIYSAIMYAVLAV